MSYKHTRLDEASFQRQFEEAVNLAMNHVGVNYSEALELVFMPLQQRDGLSVAEYVRRGQLVQAKQALVELIDIRKRSLGARRLTVPNRAV